MINIHPSEIQWLQTFVLFERIQRLLFAFQQAQPNHVRFTILVNYGKN